MTPELIGRAPNYLAAIRVLGRLALFDVPILISGETGTGKELAARSVHYQSGRRDHPFVPVNCGMLTDSLLENELFGHERGAFTDAREKSLGLVALAEGGTLFLDEVDSLSARAQVSLLRFLQDQRYRPLGAAIDRRANVRIVAATNQDLDELVAKGQFRADLLFRLKLVCVELPPLRIRDGDPELLSEHFLDECARRFAQPHKKLAPATISWIHHYRWPGNVRELENFIQREFLLCEGPTIAYASTDATPPAFEPTTSYRAAKASAIAEFDRRFLEQLLSRVDGNISRAARETGKDRRALGRLLKKYGITPASFRL